MSRFKHSQEYVVYVQNLHYKKGMSYSQIANALGTTRNSIASIIYRYNKDGTKKEKPGLRVKYDFTIPRHRNL